MTTSANTLRAPAARSPLWGRILGAGVAKKLIVLIFLCCLWEGVVRLLGVNRLLFPPFSEVAVRLAAGLGLNGNGELWTYIWETLSVILQSFAISIVIAILFTGFAVANSWVRESLGVLTGIFQPLPSIALLPMAILWFGFSRESLVFVVVMAMVWPIASSLTVGFATISPTLYRLGRNYELGHLRIMTEILLPAALPMMISGLRVGWGFGWRTVVAAELVFGATGSGGGIGWYINNSRLFMNITDGFAGILLVIIVGLFTESLFRLVQYFTTHKWGTENF
ncbi:Putative aliphatic sulfonates transport permease protein SsuC [Variovorax sp. SRS16]|uniref:ABC transporter permease n=1 Tax=Variovorax sp. SRS16 TaxID=282217 RepID=UPI0013179ABC|nr:ABC transporter permease [Variovorax sp. SRS16]VTU30729.1 Putative aliphatic sulfonates transport permease protein SsuC [Variovorax sp. SRS16]